MLAVAKKKEAIPTPFGRRLAARRVAAGLSQKALGEMVGMARLAIWRLETSPDANPTLDTIEKLAAALGCDPCDLISDGQASG